MKEILRGLLHGASRCVYCNRDVPPPQTACEQCQSMEDAARNERPEESVVLYVFRYETVVRDLICAMKFGDRPRLAYYIAQKMADFLQGYQVYADCVAYIPVHAKRRRRRGFDQCELIAGHLAVLLDVPMQDLLVRTRNTRPQWRLGAKQRSANVRGAFSMVQGQDVGGKRVLLIDDIYTTGSTAAQCMQVLREAGAEVQMLAFAREFVERN